jgi:HlyD family secretion protein
MSVLRRRLIPLLVVVAVAGAGTWAYLSTRSAGSTPKFRTAKVARGPLTATVSATGSLNAVVTVQVGSQISGQIKQLFVDFNSRVEKGQLIARIDPEIFEAKVNQARAEVESARAMVLNQQAAVEKARADIETARAGVANAKANTAKARVAVADANRDLERKLDLYRKELIARSERDSAETVRDSALAQLEANTAQERSSEAMVGAAQASSRVGEAQLQAARAALKQKEAALAQALVDLEHTHIRAPVDGVVVSRAVDVGQTVAASLQAPILFTIAQDLTKMQVDTNVDEADVGRMQVGQRVTFTVDAFPTNTFEGQVREIRKAPQVIQNVVTYNVVVNVDNPDQRLLPGMTANVRIVTSSKPSVLQVANAALRFRPPGVDADPAGAQRGGTSAAGGGGQQSQAIRERLVKGLALTDEQQRKLDPILQESRDQIGALGVDLPEQQRRQRTQKIREAAQARIRDILTPEQRAKYETMIASQGGRGATAGRVWVLGGDGKPKSITLQLGITDGSSTEVLGGDLPEGTEVLTGVISAAPAAPAPTPGANPPRLRL